MKKKEEKIKIRNEEGDIVEKKVSDIKHQPIMHSTLGPELLDRIKNIHIVLKDVMTSLYGSQGILEQFELLFMRDIDPEKDVEIWENMTKAYLESQKYFGTTPEIRKNIFNIIMLHILGLISKEDREREDIKIICSIFNNFLAFN
jgi:hypothetical protein